MLSGRRSQGQDPVPSVPAAGLEVRWILPGRLEASVTGWAPVPSYPGA
jgi:hypothetical protein